MTNHKSFIDQLPFRSKYLGLVIFLALLIALCFQLHDRLIATPTESAIRSAAEAKLKPMVEHVDNYINEQSKQLRALASIPSAHFSATSGDYLRNVFEQSAMKSLDGADYCRLIAREQANSKELPNYVALDMARRTLSGKTILPEAMKDQGSWHILFAYPIVRPLEEGETTENMTSEMRVSASLLTSFPVTALQQKLTTLANSDGRVQLLQHLPGTRQQPVLSVGSGTEKRYKVETETSIAHWRLAFTPSKKLVGAQQAPLLNRIIFYGLAILEGLLLSWFIAGLAISARQRAEERAREKRRKQELELERLANATSFLSEAPMSAGSDSSIENTSSDSHPKEDARQQPVTQERSGDDNPFDLSDDDSTDDDSPPDYAASVFRAYDIRGIYGESITKAFAKDLGRALGSLAQERNEHILAVAHDGRTSSPPLYEALIEGILSTGCDVYALGLAPTPLTNFAINHLDDTSSGVTVTASHNPPEYNGFKMSIAGIPLTPEEITGLRTRMLEQSFRDGKGARRSQVLNDAYIDHVANDLVINQDLHLVLDGSNGAAGPLATQLLERLGCQLTTLYCDIDGTFPNHLPDTSVAANLADLVSVVKAQNADLGIALDGDGDRIVAVTASGTIVWPDELMMIFARDVLARQPGADIVFDIKSSRRLGTLIGSYGGRPIMWKTGHSHIREKMRELNAPLGGEYSGHLFFNDRWFGFDDGLYAATRLLEIISLREQSLDSMLATLPRSVSSNEVRVTVDENRKFAVIDQLIATGDFKDAKLTTLDGLRVDLAKSWGLVRASNTSPELTLRFEGDTKDDLLTAKQLIKDQLAAVAPDLNLDF